jgi:hypothetical protein
VTADQTVCPEATAGLWSTITFGWISGMMKTGYKYEALASTCTCIKESAKALLGTMLHFHDCCVMKLQAQGLAICIAVMGHVFAFWHQPCTNGCIHCLECYLALR